MSRCIVTGGAGRLGRSVVRSLAEAGHEVISVDRDTVPELPAEQIVHELGDAAATRELFERIEPDAVIHLAAIAVPFSSPDVELFGTNTTLAFTVLEATLASGASSLLIASSPTVIGYGSPSGWSPSYLPIDEQHPLAPWNAYALSKQSIENLVAMAVRSIGDALTVGVFRPCYVIAPEEWAGAPTQQGHTITERLDDPSLSAVALFNYVDARDAGDFVATWVTQSASIPNGTVFFVGAADSLVREHTGQALERLVAGVGPMARSLTADAPVFSSALAERLLGWRARRSWRTELASRSEGANVG